MPVTKRDVYHGRAIMTDKGYTYKDLYVNERGRIAVKYSAKGGMVGVYINSL